MSNAWYALLFGACAPTHSAALSPEGAMVRIVDSISAGECQYVGDFVSGSGPRPMPSPWATNYVRNLAAERGATDVILEEQPRLGSVVATAYRCR
jgi:hypothetical protein